MATQARVFELRPSQLGSVGSDTVTTASAVMERQPFNLMQALAHVDANQATKAEAKKKKKELKKA